MILLALDPSLRSSGVALFFNDVLIACARVKSSMVGAVDTAHRCRFMAEEIRRFEARSDTPGDSRPDRIAVEWPQIYRTGKGKGDPNDLLGLAGVCAAVAALFPSSEVVSYLPDEWSPGPKVSVLRRRAGLGPIDSEAFTSPRGRRIMGRLSEVERALVPQSHDAVDSVGIGLHCLGRLAPRKIYPGATPG